MKLAYQDLKKIEQSAAYGAILETTKIANERGNLYFCDQHAHRMGPHGNVYETKERLTVKRSGSGVKIELEDLSGKRYKAISVELGKSQLALLVEYLAMIEGDVRDYAGEITNGKLEKF